MTLEEFEKRFQFDTAENSPDYRGSGGFGAVYRAYDSQRERYVAIKESVMRPEFRQFSLRHEVETNHEMAPHPNLLRYENNYRFQMGKLTVDYAVMRYFEHGNLDQFLRRSPDLPLAERDQLIAGLLAGLQHLRNERCIHRDLKASNVLVDKQDDHWMPVIADFGQSRFVGMGDLTSNSSESFSLDYAAPEQFEEDGKVSMATDMWAFGVLLHRIVTGRLPFVPMPGKATTGQRADVLQLITGGQLPVELSTIEQPYQEAIRQCLIKDPVQRALPSTIQLLLFGAPLEQAPSYTLSGTVINRQPSIPPSSSEPAIESKPVNEELATPKRRFLADSIAESTGTKPTGVTPATDSIAETSQNQPALRKLDVTDPASARLVPEPSGIPTTGLSDTHQGNSGQVGPGTSSGFMISHESPPAAKKNKRGVVLVGTGGLVAASVIAFFLFKPATNATVQPVQQTALQLTQSSGAGETAGQMNQDENAIVVEKPLPMPDAPASQGNKVVDSRPVINAEVIKPTNVVLTSPANQPESSAETAPKPEEKPLPLPVEKPAVNPNEVLSFAEQKPEFPGGEEGMVRWLNQHVRYPAEAQEAGISGTVFVSFVVDGDGSLSDIKIVRGIKDGNERDGTDKEAMRVIKAMPRWKAGRQGGVTVRVRQTIPIRFRIE